MTPKATRMAGVPDRARRVERPSLRYRVGAADHQHADDGGRGDAGRSGHVGQPPRDPQIPFLWCRLDPEERGFDGAVRRLGRAGLDPRPSGAFERAIVGHARRPSWTAGSGSAVRASRSPRDGVVQSRSGRARGDLEHLGDLHERQPEVVVQDEDRPLVDREPAERPLQFVAVGDGGSPVRGRSAHRWAGPGRSPSSGAPAAIRRSRRGRGSDGSTPRSGRVPADAGAGARRARGRSAARPRRDPGRAGSAGPPRRANR